MSIPRWRLFPRRALGVWAVAVLALAGVALTARARDRRDDGFPHAKHAKLFPTCTGCHAGVATGARSAVYPDSASCAQCHDGVQQPKVPWARSGIAPSNLRFDHVAHAAKPDAAQLECRSCHGVPGGPFMNAKRAEAPECVQCHTHKASAHLASDNAKACATCHVPVTQAVALSAERIGRFPKPPSHEAAGYVSSHGKDVEAAGASCATCHSRESCARCHANVGSVASAASLGSDSRISALARGKPATYPVPASHRKGGFDIEHGQQAEAATASCANCHTRPSCDACHIGPLGRSVIAKLPQPVKGGASGVRIERAPTWGQTTPLRERYTLAAFHPDTEPAQVERGEKGVRRVRPHPPGWVTHHGTEAAVAGASCSGCHTQQRFCSDCHDGEGRRRFHPANFTARHPSDAYGREKDCALCHQPEIFCRTCHVQVGLASEGQLKTAYHTGQPLWLLNHGRAARQTLQSCTTCHTQRDCMQCHSSFGWKVNPHGRGFNAVAMYARNRLMCFRCHTTDPIAGSP
jgi:hypothetical protein